MILLDVRLRHNKQANEWQWRFYKAGTATLIAEGGAGTEAEAMTALEDAANVYMRSCGETKVDVHILKVVDNA